MTLLSDGGLPADDDTDPILGLAYGIDWHCSARFHTNSKIMT